MLYKPARLTPRLKPPSKSPQGTKQDREIRRRVRGRSHDKTANDSLEGLLDAKVLVSAGKNKRRKDFKKLSACEIQTAKHAEAVRKLDEVLDETLR